VIPKAGELATTKSEKSRQQTFLGKLLAASRNTEAVTFFMPASEGDASNSNRRSEPSHSFRARLAQFSYTPDVSPTAVKMAPRTRSGAAAAAAQSETLTGTEGQLSSSRSDSEVPAADMSPENTARSQLETSNTTTKRKRATPNRDSTTPKKPRLPTTSSAKATTPENNLKDSLREGLILVSIGLNPGIMTGKLGHAYAHPTNRYWPTLHASGITPILHKPPETHTLMDLYGLGHTNIITAIASVDASSLKTQDYMEGAAALEAKIRHFRPQAVAIVGKGIWEEWVRYKKGRRFNVKKDGFEYGWQDPSLWIGRKEGGDDAWDGARTFVTTTTSGASTAHTKEQRVAIWKPLGDWFAPKRDEWMMRRKA